MPGSSRAQNKAVKAPEPVLASLHRSKGPKNRKICGTATSFGPACYNVNMYHAENMLQTNASKHAYQSNPKIHKPISKSFDTSKRLRNAQL